MDETNEEDDTLELAENEIIINGEIVTLKVPVDVAVCSDIYWLSSTSQHRAFAAALAHCLPTGEYKPKISPLQYRNDTFVFSTLAIEWFVKELGLTPGEIYGYGLKAWLLVSKAIIPTVEAIAEAADSADFLEKTGTGKGQSSISNKVGRNTQVGSTSKRKK